MINSKSFGTAILALFALGSCHNKAETSKTSKEKTTATPAPVVVPEFGELDSLMKPYQAPAQVFEMEGKSVQIIKGKAGTKIKVDPTNLETEDGLPIEGKISVTLIELDNKLQMMMQNVQTVSDGKLLVSGGAYFIDCTSGGKKLKLKKGKSLSISFPKYTDKRMDLFYGQAADNGTIDWKPAVDKFTPAEKPDSIIRLIPVETITTIAKPGTISLDSPISMKVADIKKATGIARTDDRHLYFLEDVFHTADTCYESLKVPAVYQDARDFYKEISIQKLGWINCDYFYKMSSKSDMVASISGSMPNMSLRVFTVFKSLNSVMIDNLQSGADGTVAYKKVIGRNEPFIIMVVGFQNGRLFAAKKEMNQAKDSILSFALNMEQIDAKKMKGMHFN